MQILSSSNCCKDYYSKRGARKATSDYGKSIRNHSPAFGVQTSHQGRFYVIGGGLPLFVDSQIVRGIGCSSGTSDQDIVVAQAGLDASLKVK